MEGPVKTQLTEAVKGMVPKLKKIVGSPSWLANGNEPCQMFKMEIEGRVACKGICTVNYPLEKVIEFFNLPDATPRINDMVLKYDLLEKNEDFKVIHMEFKATWPVSNRDFVVIGARQQEGDTLYICTQSCQFPKPEVKGVVRGNLHIGGYVLAKIDANSTLVTYVSDSDPMGNIPQMIKNTISIRQGGVASKIEPAMKKAGL